ncbi:MAG: twin transmembrane helix small protein [Rhizobiaceae bacterium]
MKILLLIACFAVAIILFKGLWNMLRGGSPNTSQKLMRLRIAAQAIALVIALLVVYLSR